VALTKGGYGVKESVYTDQQLNRAVKAGVFTEESVGHFRDFVENKYSHELEEQESFRLISGFNDLFVVIACSVFFVSLLFFYDNPNLLKGYHYESPTSIAMKVVIPLVAIVMSWILSDFFVLKRQMALTAITLLSFYAVSIFLLMSSLFTSASGGVFAPVSMTAFAVFLHWQKFKVPISIAAVFGIVVIYSNVNLLDSNIRDLFSPWMFFVFNLIAGLLIFKFAMYWDALDIKRIGRQSDTAFWLHLISAPMIVHPIFSGLDLMDANLSLLSSVVLLVLFGLFTFISLIIDRRVFILSSMVYFVHLIEVTFSEQGLGNFSLGFTGLFIGLSLLLLSGYWTQARSFVLKGLPEYIKTKVPGV